MKRTVLRVGWAVVAALVFSGWHYVGALGDEFEATSFVFRAVCGLVFTLIYVYRGFAPAVWTHAIYDIWVLVL
jgi:membrane protease YdiL (CAAX protease family)